MHPPDQSQADRLSLHMSTMRAVVNSVRAGRLNVRIGGPEATAQGQWLLLLGSMAVVFACFFAVGRMQIGGGQASGETPSELQGSPARSAIPAGLSGESPISGAVPIAIVQASRPTPPAPRPRSSGRVALSAPAPTESFVESSREASVSSESAPSAPASEPESTPAPTPKATKAGGGSAGGGTPRSNGAGGGSFDNSG